MYFYEEQQDAYTEYLTIKTENFIQTRKTKN